MAIEDGDAGQSQRLGAPWGIEVHPLFLNVSGAPICGNETPFSEHWVRAESP